MDAKSIRIQLLAFLCLGTGILIGGCQMQKTAQIFQTGTNIGGAAVGGSHKFDAKSGTYTLSGAGSNIWETRDEFYFLWRKTGGDLDFAADLKWRNQGTHAHRKAGLMLRAGLAPNAAYADVAVHGDGLISLQYRHETGATTQEVKAPLKAPASLLLQRRGGQVSLGIAAPGAQDFSPIATISLALPDSFYAGLFVCSHDSTQQESAEFSHLALRELGAIADTGRVVESTLEILNIETGQRRIVRRAQAHFEAPNWSRDGKFLLYNSGGRLFTIPVAGGEPQQLDTGFADHCNNDHGFSPDGRLLAISHHPADGASKIYVLPATGGEPKLVTPKGPSYWHGWSPDGKTLAYCAERNGEYDIYAIPAAGGAETRLTNARGLDDGPDYAPDGQFIYFNSVRTGKMRIWRMRADGSEQTQLTSDAAFNDWFPHPSPDGKWLVFVSFDESVEGHPPNKDVVLRLMPATGGEAQTIATFFGGQGTINVPSWSPDSKEFAFVSYRLVPPAGR